MSAYADNALVPLDGRTGRVICASNRAMASAASVGALAAAEPALPIEEGRDRHGLFIRYSVRKGDISANERARYAPAEAPMRAFITLEDMGNVPRWLQRITQHFGLVVEPGPTILENLFVVFAQENAYPEDGKSWKSPPVELGLVAKTRMKLAASGKLVADKDPTGRPYLDEFLRLTVRTLDAAGNQITACEIISNKPIVRGQFYKIAFAYVDGRGSNGRAELYIDGKLQGAIFKGRTGYPGFRSPYPAIGVYAHVGQVGEISVRIYGWQEGPAT